MKTQNKKQTGVTVRARSPLMMVTTQMLRSNIFQIIRNNNFITLTAIIKNKTVSVKIEKITNSKKLRFSLNTPFTSKVSFFDYSQVESRFTRDKGVIKIVIDELKRFEVWHLFDKSCLTINPHNKKGKGNQIKKEYNLLING